MTQEEIYNTIESLAQSQGSYGRLKRALDTCEPSQKVEFLEQFTHCKDPVDFILALEG